MRVSSLVLAGLALGASVASAAEVHPFAEPSVTGDVAFLETFSSGKGAWKDATDDKYNGARRKKNERSAKSGAGASSRLGDDAIAIARLPLHRSTDPRRIAFVRSSRERATDRREGGRRSAARARSRSRASSPRPIDPSSFVPLATRSRAFI